MTQRTVLAVAGADRRKFLQDLITNDIARADEGGIVYAALLTPQGKLIADFFVVAEPERYLIDVATPLAPTLFQRLSMYRLRSDVTIDETGLSVRMGLADAPEGALTDPRDPALGWRMYGSDSGGDIDWDALRVANMIPESGRELGPETYILEMGFERLGGVDFRKGCYVGQEVTARMKHKTALRKGLARVRVEGDAEEGAEITADGRAIGTLHTRAGHEALAYLRFDRAGGEMRAGDAVVTLLD